MPGPDSTPPKRQRLSPEARRQQLVDIALDLLLTGPLDEVTVENVAGRADVSKSLIFHYFPTIRDLHLAVLEVAAQLLVQMLEEALTDDPAPIRLARGVEVFVDFIGLQPGSFDALSSMAATDPEFNRVFQSVRDKAGQMATDTFGEATGPLDDYLLAGWVSFVETVVRTWVSKPAGIERQTLIDRIVLATEGLAAARATPVES